MLKSKQIMGCLLGLCLALSLPAQVRFQCAPFTEGVVPVDRLFQFSLLNTSNQATSGQVTIRLTAGGSQLVAQYTSLPITLNGLEGTTGAQMDWLKAAEFGVSASATLLREQGVLPYGQYAVCYTFADGKTITQPICGEIASKPQVPPRLNTPTDKEVILTTNPLLTWIPPMPDYGFGFQYHLRLVELKESQTCVQALTQNVRLVNERGQEETVYQMNDANGLGLEVGKNYCWQVDAFTKSGDVGSTEIWQFTVGETALVAALPPPYDPYTLMKQAPDSEYSKPMAGITPKKLRIAFQNRSSAPKLKYIIRPEIATTTTTYPPTDLTNLISGMNFIELALPNLVVNRSYVLELTDEQNITYYCRFIY